MGKSLSTASGNGARKRRCSGLSRRLIDLRSMNDNEPETMDETSDEDLLLTRPAILSALDHLHDWAFGDIKRASDGGAKMGAFILGCCYIDALARFHAGNITGKKLGDVFKCFVKKFMREYGPDADKLWAVRNSLVHAYATKDFAFTDAEKAGEHGDTDPRGRTLLNLEDFMDHIQRAYDGLRKHIATDETGVRNALDRYKDEGILGPTVWLSTASPAASGYWEPPPTDVQTFSGNGC